MKNEIWKISCLFPLEERANSEEGLASWRLDSEVVVRGIYLRERVHNLSRFF
jgi:hypothetical protein